jgi:fructokinase
MKELAAKADAICFGSLAQRDDESQHSIRSFISATKPGCLRVFDINLRQKFYSEKLIINSLDLSDVLKLNDDELPVVAHFLGFTGTPEEQIEMILERFNLKFIVFTLGSRGSIIKSANESSFSQAPEVIVADAVGAGDAFTAVFIAGILKGIPLKETHQKATEIAAYVCTQKGATPKYPKNIF